jgi:hypothetical protein
MVQKSWYVKKPSGLFLYVKITGPLLEDVMVPDRWYIKRSVESLRTSNPGRDRFVLYVKVSWSNLFVTSSLLSIVVHLGHNLTGGQWRRKRPRALPLRCRAGALARRHAQLHGGGHLHTVEGISIRLEDGLWRIRSTIRDRHAHPVCCRRRCVVDKDNWT